MNTASPENVLDVRVLQPKQKHPSVFARFDELSDGESLTIYNDHDPKPLYYQLLAERGKIFSWEYLEQGPQSWKIKVTKNISDGAEETLGEIVAGDIRKADVFKKYGLDFCCGGKRTLQQACKEQGIDYMLIGRELQQADKTPAGRPLPYADWSLDFLCDYIVNTHHSYVKNILPELRNYAIKVADVHGNSHPELLRICQLVENINAELTSHMIKEEKVLFPYIKELVAATAGNRQLDAFNFDGIQNPVNMMEAEHEMVGQYLEEVRMLSNSYQLPADACGSYSWLYKTIAAFEADLHIHIHLENNILFPKAVQLEKKLKGN